MRDNTPSEQSFTPDPSSLEISDETYRKLHDLSIEMVKETILGKAREMCPVLFVHFRQIDKESGMLGDLQHAVVVIACGFGDKKRETIFDIGKQFSEKQMIPAAVFMGAESWMSRKPKAGVIPSQDPDREEVIVIQGKSIGKECSSMTTIPISRNEDGFIIQSGEPFVMPDKGTLETPLLDQFYYGFFDKAMKRHEQHGKYKPDHHRG